jgi:hypothetical protein
MLSGRVLSTALQTTAYHHFEIDSAWLHFSYKDLDCFSELSTTGDLTSNQFTPTAVGPQTVVLSGIHFPYAVSHAIVEPSLFDYFADFEGFMKSWTFGAEPSSIEPARVQEMELGAAA